MSWGIVWKPLPQLILKSWLIAMHEALSKARETLDEFEETEK